MYIIPNEESAKSIVDFASNTDHLEHKFKNFRNRFELPETLYGDIFYFQADDNLLNEMTKSELVEFSSVIDVTTEIPEVYSKYYLDVNKTRNVKDEIFEFLNKIEFDDLPDAVAIISPFIGVYRSIIIEVFTNEVAKKYVDSFIKKDKLLSIKSTVDGINSRIVESIEKIDEDEADVALSVIKDINTKQGSDVNKDDKFISSKPGRLW
jgi:hypothetical protein